MCWRSVCLPVCVCVCGGFLGYVFAGTLLCANQMTFPTNNLKTNQLCTWCGVVGMREMLLISVFFVYFLSSPFATARTNIHTHRARPITKNLTHSISHTLACEAVVVFFSSFPCTSTFCAGQSVRVGEFIRAAMCCRKNWTWLSVQFIIWRHWRIYANTAHIHQWIWAQNPVELLIVRLQSLHIVCSFLYCSLAIRLVCAKANHNYIWKCRRQKFI